MRQASGEGAQQALHYPTRAEVTRPTLVPVSGHIGVLTVLMNARVRVNSSCAWERDRRRSTDHQVKAEQCGSEAQ